MSTRKVDQEMRPRRQTIHRSIFPVTVVICMLLAHSALGAYVAVEDFEGLDLGSINGQNGWVAGLSSLVATDPAGGENQVLSVTSLATTVRKEMLLSDETTRMVFMRFRFAQQLSVSFGLSHLLNPDEFSDFGPELSLTSSSNDLRIANGPTTGVYDELTDVDPNTWYNVWMRVDNSLDTTQAWLNQSAGEAASDDDLLVNEQGEDIFGFRISGSNDLINFYIKTASGGSGDFGPLYIDDIYLENSDLLNLYNPTSGVPNPTGDFDQDIDVDGDDFLAWQRNNGIDSDATLAQGDANRDGAVNGEDLEVWQDQFGTSQVANIAAVPEPATLILALVGCILGLMRKGV